MNDILITRRPNTEIASIPDDKRTLFDKVSEGRYSLTFFSDKLIKIELWDCIMVSGKRYYQNQYPEIRKIEDKNFVYVLDLITKETPRKGAFTH